MVYDRATMKEGSDAEMTPKERIRAIRLMERFSEQSEYLHRIGVDVTFRNCDIDHEHDNADD